MEMHEAAAGPPKSLLRILILIITGVDDEILSKCPYRDWEAVRALGIIMICSWLYMTGLFTLVCHRIFAAAGQIRPDLFIISGFLATFILFIDSYVVMRSGWHLVGIEELKRGGMDVSGGRAARIKAGVFLGCRIGLLSVPISLLCGIFACLSIYATDIDKRVGDASRAANASLYGPATVLVDGQIRRGTDAVGDQTTVVNNLSRQISTLRQKEIDPSAADPQVQEAQRELQQLISQKAKADDDAAAASALASNEGGGIATAGTSGQPGRGARYRAAKEREDDAKTRAQQFNRELNAARDRLDALRKQAPPVNDDVRQRLRDQRLAMEQAFDSETLKLTRLKDSLAALISGRENAIRRAVEESPQHARADDGFLAQVRVLEELGQEDKMVGWILILFDVASFALELAAVLAKVLSFVPTTYAGLLARDDYMGDVRIVDVMQSELDRRRENQETGILAPEHPNAGYQGNGAAVPNGSGAVGSMSASAKDNVAPPAKRPRGRPRKHPLPALNGKAA
jgi:hypothetical protein